MLQNETERPKLNKDMDIHDMQAHIMDNTERLPEDSMFTPQHTVTSCQSGVGSYQHMAKRAGDSQETKMKSSLFHVDVLDPLFDDLHEENLASNHGNHANFNQQHNRLLYECLEGKLRSVQAKVGVLTLGNCSSTKNHSGHRLLDPMATGASVFDSQRYSNR